MLLSIIINTLIIVGATTGLLLLAAITRFLYLLSFTIKGVNDELDEEEAIAKMRVEVDKKILENMRKLR